MIYRRAYIELQEKDEKRPRCYIRRVRHAADGSLFVRVGRQLIFLDDPPYNCRFFRPLNFTFDTKVTRIVDAPPPRA